MTTDVAIPQPHLHLVARSPAEMEKAQNQLIQWATTKIEAEFRPRS